MEALKTAGNFTLSDVLSPFSLYTDTNGRAA